VLSNLKRIPDNIRALFAVKITIKMESLLKAGFPETLNQFNC